MRVLFWVSAVIFLCDQAVKYYVVHVLRLDRVLAIDVWPPFFNLRMAWNDGINFGILGGAGDWKRWLLIAVALVISGAVIWWIRREPGSAWYNAAAGLLVGGALGNVIDRLIYGAVADFINMSCCGIRNPFVFNIADISIFVGAVGLVLLAPDNSGKRGKKAA